MEKQTLINFLLSQGWEKDRWGYYHKGNYRIGVTNTSVSLRVKSTIEASQYSPKRSFWTRLKSGYLKNISITPENKIRGLSYSGCQIQNLSKPTQGGTL